MFISSSYPIFRRAALVCPLLSKYPSSLSRSLAFPLSVEFLFMILSIFDSATESNTWEGWKPSVLRYSLESMAS